MSKLILQPPGGDERAVPLRAGETFTVGRDDHHAVTLDDGTVSRRHARLTWREDGVPLLEDLQSANGTTLNGAPLTRPEPLQDGDRLGFGEVAAIYLASDAQAAELPALALTAGDMFAARYRMENSLGETDEYHNFRAVDVGAGAALVSLKIFHPEVITRAGGFDVVRGNFARVRATPPYPGLVPLLEFGRWRGSEYLVSKWIEGYPLLDLLRRRGAIPRSGALRLASQAAAVTDHARAHALPTPDLAPSAVLLSFREPLSPAAWEQMLDAPPEQWPAFTLQITPRLFTPVPQSPWPLGALLCELLGHPLAGPGLSRSSRPTRPPRIASLGERGNAVLARGAGSAREAGGGDASFIAELMDAVEDTP